MKKLKSNQDAKSFPLHFNFYKNNVDGVVKYKHETRFLIDLHLQIADAFVSKALYFLVKDYFFATKALKKG
jgi:hypothetical protein